ncbi:MAG: asparagine synthase (glutamine-hydrolyzing), partial [Bacteroidota bacterium]|nr:asparagine synthase (glutamine-hydrolyzing) [Bacteroidota bacterium]
DDEGFLVDNHVGLGFRRLSIIDLSTGHQPLANQDESIWIVFNGEIYNYQEQREFLLKKGYQFRTATDTEVILHLYEEFGVDCLQYLQGMFGFAIWDKNRQQLFCARDRFGIKPFYYYLDKEKFAFGSEIKAILEVPGIDRTLSYDALDSYFAFGYITSDLSIFEKIHKLQPAHYLLVTFKDGISIDVQRYWDIHFEPDYSKTETQWMEEIEDCLSRTVKMHMVADVPLGAFLSGGIDSSSVVALMARNSNRPIKTFSIGFKEKEFNELEYAREVADRYGCDHHEQIVEPESIGLLPKLVHAYDEPFGDTSAIPTYYVSKLAREYVTVALSGDGGDELFAGYSSYPDFNRLHNNRFNFNSPLLNSLIWGTIHRLLPHGVKGKDGSFFLSKNKDILNAYKHIWSMTERRKLIRNGIHPLDYSKGSELYKEALLKNKPKSDFITTLQYLDLKTYMVDSVLTKVDRASMLSSLEVRVPILDHKFAELSFKIPSTLKMKGGDQKYIFKKAMAGLLPPNILSHPKQGFSVPLTYWFKDDLKEYVHDTLLSSNARLSSILNRDYVTKIVQTNHHEKKKDLSNHIWSLLFLEEWLRQYT